MDPELIELRARVEILERALAAASRSGALQPGPRRATPLVCGVMAAIVAAAALVFSLPATPRAAGPTTVTAPFTVVDDSGRTLIQVRAEKGRGGHIAVYNDKQVPQQVVEIAASPSGCCGWVAVYKEQESPAKAVLGVDGGDNGLLELKGEDSAYLAAGGWGVSVANADGHGVAKLVAAEDKDGYLSLRNSSDKDSMLEVAASQGGGFIKILNPSGKSAAEISADKNGAGMVAVGGKIESDAIFMSTGDDGAGNLTLRRGTIKILNQSKKAAAEMSATGNDGLGMLSLGGKDQFDAIFMSAGQDGGGNLAVQGKQGKTALFMNATPDGAGALSVWGKNGSEVKVGLGVNSSNGGVITVNGSTGKSAIGIAEGQIFGRNADGGEVMAVGVDLNGQGHFTANNKAGVTVAEVSVGNDGTGMMQVWKSASELAAIMGTKDGSKGDVCANGPKAQVCLSILAIKTFTPW